MRRLIQVTVLLMAAALATAAPVSASYVRTVSVLGVDAPLFGWTGEGNFGAAWTVQSHSDGTTTVSLFETWSTIENGKQCVSPLCDSWIEKTSYTFLKSDGVTKIGSAHVPPYATDWCHGTRAFNANDKVWIRCQVPALTLPASAAKVHIHWVVTGFKENGFAFNWVADKTVSIG